MTNTQEHQDAQADNVADVRSTGYMFPARRIALPAPTAVCVDILEVREPGTDSGQGASTLHVPQEVVINGQRLLMPLGSEITVTACPSDATKITMTMFAQRVRFGHTDTLLDND